MRLISFTIAAAALVAVIPMGNDAGPGSQSGIKSRADWLARTDVSFCDRYLHLCGARHEVADILARKAHNAETLAVGGAQWVQTTETWRTASSFVASNVVATVAGVVQFGRQSIGRTSQVQVAHGGVSADDVAANFANANRWRRVAGMSSIAN
jgi:hypothetical protein